MIMKLSKLSWILLLTLSVFITACNNDDEDMPDTPQAQSIVEIAAADAQFSTLVAALQRVDLVSTLEGDGPFTVFAPTNDAFAGVDIDALTDDQLKEILLYHVVGADIKSTDLADGQTYTGTAAATGPNDSALSILVEKDANGVTVNNVASVTTADVDATNGTIHIINSVITPLDVVGHAAANENFTSLVSTLGAADGDLVDVLSGDGPFTVFAPLNSAFDAISDVTAGLDGAQLSKVLLYHVVSGNVRSDALSDEMNVPTANDNIEFTVNIDGSTVTLTDVSGNEAGVVLTDVQATNGVIHVLNKVIIPDNL